MTQLEFKIKITHELSRAEKEQLCLLFKNVFDKDMPLSDFEKKYSDASYHGLMIADNTIVGGYSVMPVKYDYFGRERVFGLAVDTMIDEEHRGNIFHLKKLACLVYDALKKDGISFVFGFPNENIYLVRKKLLKWQDIGQLDYYILPLRIGAIKKKLVVLNWLTGLTAALVNRSGVKASTGEITKFNIEKKNDDQFMALRYDDAYKIVKPAAGTYFVYKISKEEGARLAHLIDVFPLSKKMVEHSVKHIYDNEKNRVDGISYVGKLRSRPANLFKVPKIFQPKPLRMAGRILISGLVDDRIFDLNNWNVNLSNFDAR